MQLLDADITQAGRTTAMYYRTGIVKAEGLIAEGTAGGARLVVFPEAFIGGYPMKRRFRYMRRIANAGRP